MSRKRVCSTFMWWWCGSKAGNNLGSHHFLPNFIDIHSVLSKWNMGGQTGNFLFYFRTLNKEHVLWAGEILCVLFVLVGGAVMSYIKLNSLIIILKDVLIEVVTINESYMYVTITWQFPPINLPLVFHYIIYHLILIHNPHFKKWNWSLWIGKMGISTQFYH